MIDIIDKTVKNHIQSMVKIQGKSLRVFSIATADQDDQIYTQAGLDNKTPDRVELPFLSLIRLPHIEVTDNHMTKRIHNYAAFPIYRDEETGKETKLTYYRATLKYVLTLFAENRKVSEDIMTSIYAGMRNNNQIRIVIQLPIDYPGNDGEPWCAEMECDIIMGSSIEQVMTQDLTKSQIYKCRIDFELQNVNIYNITEISPTYFNIILETREIKTDILVDSESIFTSSPEQEEESTEPKFDNTTLIEELEDHYQESEQG